MYKQKVFAIIPIRHESQRLPGKNYKLLGDRPLYHWIIETLLSLEEITGIIIDTNSPIIKDGCERLLRQRSKDRLIVVDRDRNLTGPTVSTNTLIESLFSRDLPFNKYDDTIFLQTHVTNPFLKAETIRDAISKFKEALSSGSHDSLFSVSRWRTRLYDKDYKPINHDTKNLIQTQDLPPIYEDNSCIYLFTRDSFEKNKNRLGLRPYFYTIEDGEELVDIDWLSDFELAEAYLHVQQKKKNQSKLALITGASGGIGYATATLFKQAGWKVIGTDLELREKSQGGPYDRFIATDLRLETAATTLFEEVSRTESRLDALINVAAIQDCAGLSEVIEKRWDELMNCNLKTPYFLAQKFLPLLLEAKGSIVNVSSIHAFQTSANISPYAISKAGLSGLTRSLAVELGKHGIRVNSVCPGATDTAMLRAGLSRSLVYPGAEQVEKVEVVEGLLEKLAAKHLMGFIGEPIDIANAIYFLADNDKARFITGLNLVVDGGATIKLSTE